VRGLIERKELRPGGGDLTPGCPGRGRLTALSSAACYDSRVHAGIHKAETPVISMRNVSHFFGSGALRKQILFEITCEILPGEIVIMTGPSGSGKTTILTLVGALRSVEHGSLRVLGEELNGASHDTQMRVRQRIGFIFQAHNLLDALTAAQNVEVALGVDPPPAREARARSAAVLQAVGLSERVHYHPPQLSGGERQRVAIARALVRHPQIILADEPTASLDKHSGREVVELLRQLARREGCAVLLVTHDNRILDIADRIMTLEDGRMGAFGSVTSPYAGHLLTALSHLPEKDHVRFLLKDVQEGDFVDLLKTLGGEVEQFLNILNLGNHESVCELFGTLLDGLLSKIAELLDASGAGLVGRDGEHLRPTDPQARPDPAVTARVVATGRTLNASGTDLGPGIHSALCVPLRDRMEEICVVAQLVNKKTGGRFTDADERAFRDFAVPLGVLVEAWQRLRVDTFDSPGARSRTDHDARRPAPPLA
jgi:putative ABC transport system ATP-binding protein